MEKFIKPSDIKSKREKRDKYFMDDFVQKMNKKLKNGDNTLNSSFDKVHLSDVEFKYLKAEAKKAGWVLTRFEDNYNTTTYKMETL